jgi:hypothetical protein
MEMEMEGLDGDEAEAMKMMALHVRNVPDYTWILPRGYDYDWSKPTFPRNPDLWKTAKTFLTEALDSSGTDVAEVDVPVRKIYEEVVHNNIRDAMASQSAVLYKVFGKIREWMEWEAGDQNSKFVPLRLTVRGAACTGNFFNFLSSIPFSVI